MKFESANSNPANQLPENHARADKVYFLQISKHLVIWDTNGSGHHL